MCRTPSLKVTLSSFAQGLQKGPIPFGLRALCPIPSRLRLVQAKGCETFGALDAQEAPKAKGCEIFRPLDAHETRANHRVRDFWGPGCSGAHLGLLSAKKSCTVRPVHKESCTVWPERKKSCTVCPRAEQAPCNRLSSQRVLDFCCHEAH